MTMKDADIFKKLKRITFEEFKKMAVDNTLSNHEKIGFPDSYRQEFAQEILNDIISKIPAFSKKEKVILDIGCGCDELAIAMIELCKNTQNRLILMDSEEMLSLLPEPDFVSKIPGKFPENISRMEPHFESIDGIIVYSVLQHVILDSNVFDFIDKALALLRPGGTLLLGDIPNISKRKRFFSSPLGIKTHQEFTKTKEVPQVNFLEVEYEKIDDGIIGGILQRYRSFGFETYLVPQKSTLPMATRREDILIVKAQ